MKEAKKRLHSQRDLNILISINREAVANGEGETP